ncbi:uncharacterized protein LOC135100927 [Scylla paramamosain]|uniref:uncharacterized protein LOC135100927 n=1 Tax=Scylla paramamosain TaxID=85552 RepID=UPI003083E7EF
MWCLKQSSQANIVYLDETWVNQSYTVGKGWTDTTSEAATGVQPLTGKGGCLIILHAGTRDGFINNAELIFQAKNDGDYHKQMNSTVFEEWFRNQLLPNIAPNSIIITDNAPYHSVLQEKVPSSLWRKVELKEWPERKDVQLSDELLKTELYELTKKFAAGKKYCIGSIADLAGYRVEALCHIMPHNWMQAVAHAEHLQEEDGRQDIVVDHFADSLTIDIAESSDKERSDSGQRED